MCEFGQLNRIEYLKEGDDDFLFAISKRWECHFLRGREVAMRFFGSILMALGILVGIAVGAFTVVGGSAFGLTWFISAAIAKLAFLGAIGLLGAGAILQRIDRRRQDRALADRSSTTRIIDD